MNLRVRWRPRCSGTLRSAMLLGAVICGSLALGCNKDEDGGATPRASDEAVVAVHFEAGPCEAALPDGQPSSGVRCGFVVVPARHDNTTDRSIRLAVMALKAEGPQA